MRTQQYDGHSYRMIGKIIRGDYIAYARRDPDHGYYNVLMQRASGGDLSYHGSIKPGQFTESHWKREVYLLLELADERGIL